jgi:hypothetical protein
MRAAPETIASTASNSASSARSIESVREKPAAVEQDRLLRQPFQRRARIHAQAVSTSASPLFER